MNPIAFSQPQVERLRRLLHLEYTLAELAEELECSQALLHRAVAAGCPHRRDDRKRILIIGDQFAQWVHARPVPPKAVLAVDEAYCLACRAPRKIVNVFATVKNSTSPGTELVKGYCELCGARVNRLRAVAK